MRMPSDTLLCVNVEAGKQGDRLFDCAPIHYTNTLHCCISLSAV